jgi:hypothetical protein
MNYHTGWAEAEREADRRSGDAGVPVAVVEDYATTPPALLIMPEAEADAYVLEHDAEIQYVTQTRAWVILARIKAWTEQHAEHTEAGKADLCGCDLYDDVIHWLPDFDPLDPPNLSLVNTPRYVLLDGTVIDGTTRRGDGSRSWRVINPGQP